MSDQDQTQRGDGYRSLPGRLRESAAQARAIDRSGILLEAAKELERLYVAIDCYCHSSSAACREIAALKAQVDEPKAKA